MNYKVYNAQMVKSAYDKLGFVDKAFDVDAIVDFGCADGSITEMIRIFYPEALIIGYDKFQKNKSTSDIVYTQSWEEVEKLIDGKTTLLVMNSVVHEILNYEENPFEFLQKLFSNNFKYIWIRDLYICPLSDNKEWLRVANILREKYEEQVKDFEAIYGALAYPQNVLHFLMKFRYVENWRREVKEDYTLFAQSFRKIIDMLEPNYWCEVGEMYVLPHTRKVNKEDFDIDLEFISNTHYKGLFRLKEWD